MISTDKLIARSLNDGPTVLRDFLAIRAGIRMPHAGMALAQELAESRIKPKDLIEPLAHAGALTRSDIDDVTTQLVHVVRDNFPEPAYRKLAVFLEAADYRPQEIIAGVADVAPNSTIDESGEIPTAHLYSVPLEKAYIRRKASRIIVGFELIQDRADWLSTVPAGLLQSVYRDEAADLFALLESNPNLADGQPVFGVGNSVAGNSFSEVLAMFRAQKVRGGERILGAEPRFVITPASTEIAIRKELKEADLNQMIEVIPRADVTNTYLLADPAMSPAIFRLALDDRPYLETDPVPGQPGAIAITSGHSSVFKIGSRHGLCRMTPT